MYELWQVFGWQISTCSLSGLWNCNILLSNLELRGLPCRFLTISNSFIIPKLWYQAFLSHHYALTMTLLTLLWFITGLQEEIWDNCAAHLIHLPSLGEYHPMLTIFWYLQIIVSWSLWNFLFLKLWSKYNLCFYIIANSKNLSFSYSII